jgi:hypothetical protein
MRYPGLTIFLVFFGIGLLDAFRGGHWARAFFWVGMGLLFFAMDRARKSRKADTDHGQQHPT